MKPGVFDTFKARRGVVRRMARKFIQKAIKHPGALRKTVREQYGRAGFTARGTIKEPVLHHLAKQHGVTGRRARLAETLRGFHHKRR